MLPARHRMRSSLDFEAAVRRGRRAGRRTLVVHLAVVPAERDVVESASTECEAAPARRPPRVGFVVSKAVGSAVVRNGVKRRLRALMRDRLEALPCGARAVVRANPSSAGADVDVLARDLDSALEALGYGPSRHG